jgi:XTP/dITP diphosphohydrolase
MAIVATNNPGKLKEIRDLLDKDFKLLTLADVGHNEELAEDQDTIEGNAIQKATFIYGKYKQACFADDSGLEVEALRGAPGVYSAMYAGPQRNHDDNIRLLLKNLEGSKNRAATFKTVIAYCNEAGHVTLFEGLLRGQIIRAKQGSGGFGYDPVFLPDGHGKTLAQMSLEEKNQISHRSIAVRKLANFLNHGA